MRKLLLLLCAASILVMTAMPAQAQGSWNYYWHGTCPGNSHHVLLARLSNNTGWPNPQKAAIGDAVTGWNHAATGSCTPQINVDFITGGDWHADCSMVADIIIERVGGKFLADRDGVGTQGETEQIHNGITQAMNCAHLMFADFTANDPYGDESYYGNNNPEPNNRVGEEGVITHELGHVLGSGHWQDAGHSDYCRSYAQGGSPGEYRTMCGNTYKKQNGDSQENAQTSLESEDVTAFNGSYN